MWSGEWDDLNEGIGVAEGTGVGTAFAPEFPDGTVAFVGCTDFVGNRDLDGLMVEGQNVGSNVGIEGVLGNFVGFIVFEGILVRGACVGL